MLNTFRNAGVVLSLDGDRLKVEGLKQLSPDQAQEIRQKIQDNREQIISELQIPAPDPAGLGPEYERLWHRTWKLADYIDNPDGAPLADRRAKLPELDRLRERMAEIERQAGPPAGPEPETSPPGTWMPWESSSSTRDRNPDTCPARCRRMGKCYAEAYFKGKPGKVMDCKPDDCKWIPK